MTVPSLELRPDQNKCAQVATERHWSGFLSNRDDDMAQLLRSVSWLSSPRQVSRSKVAMMSAMAVCWARVSVISSSYSVNACVWVGGVLCVCVCVWGGGG